MPDGQQGLYIDHHIYLNPDQSQEDLLSTIGEEIGHYLTSAGDITAQDTNENANKNAKPATLVLRSWSRPMISSLVLKKAAKHWRHALII